MATLKDPCWFEECKCDRSLHRLDVAHVHIGGWGGKDLWLWLIIISFRRCSILRCIQRTRNNHFWLVQSGCLYAYRLLGWLCTGAEWKTFTEEVNSSFNFSKRLPILSDVHNSKYWWSTVPGRSFVMVYNLAKPLSRVSLWRMNMPRLLRW